MRSILRILGRPMEGAERYPLRSRQSWQAAPPRPRQLTMILLYAAPREPRRGETPVTRASAVPAAALAWGSSVEYRQQRKSKKAAPQGAIPPRYGAAFSALRQKYGDRPPPRSLFRHPFSSLFQSSERPAFTPPPYPPDDPHICAAGQNSEKRYRYGSERQLLRHHPSAAPASGKRQLQRKGAAEGGGTDCRGQRRGHHDFSLIFFIFQ